MDLSLLRFGWVIAEIVAYLFGFMMTDDFSQVQYCFPGVNSSCVSTQLDVGTTFALYVLFTLFTIVIILGNFVVIVSVGHFKQLHKPTNVLILSLALVDLLVGVIVIPVNAIRTIHGCWYYGDTFCQAHSSFDIFLTTLSIFHLVCIAIDRYQAICNPLHYSRKMTMSVAWTMVCGSWALAAAYSFGVVYSKANVEGLEDYHAAMNCLGSCSVLFNTLWGILDSVTSFFFPCTVMVCLYTKIFIVAKEHVRKMQDISKCANNRKRDELINKSEHKAAKTLFIVLGAFIICWMPLFANALIGPFVDFTLPFAVLRAFVWLGYFNSSLNPIIYALFYPCFKKCFYCIITLKIFSSNSSTMNLSVK